MSEKYYQEQGINRAFISKETLKALLIAILACWTACFFASLAIWGGFNKPENNPLGMDLRHIYIPIITIVISLVGILGPILIVCITRIYMGKYVRNFKYKLTNFALEIRSGVFNKNKATIPYSRIQNINIVCGVFDRIYKTYTILIDTAGFSAAQAQGGHIGRPEGYIPGLKDPHGFEVELRQMLDKYSTLSSGLEEKIFKPHELAFDNFISYILTKLRDKDDLLKTKIKTIREKANLSVIDLAQKVGVRNETIELLEAGRYTQIARELNCRIEDLFQFD
ncbi:MAG: PH domain-containing protein [Candidatus Helarchaeota archaeon]